MQDRLLSLKQPFLHPFDPPLGLYVYRRKAVFCHARGELALLAASPENVDETGDSQGTGSSSSSGLILGVPE